MKFINKPRRSGKTYGLIYASEATGFPIVVTTADRYNSIVGMANDMGCSIPEAVERFSAQRSYKGDRAKWQSIL